MGVMFVGLRRRVNVKKFKTVPDVCLKNILES